MHFGNEFLKLRRLSIDVLIPTDADFNSFPFTLNCIRSLLEIETPFLVFKVPHEAAGNTNNKSDAQNSPARFWDLNNQPCHPGRRKRSNNHKPLQGIMNIPELATFRTKLIDLSVGILFVCDPTDFNGYCSPCKQ